MRGLETLSIQCGQGGLNSSPSPDVVRDTDLTAVEAIIYEDDTWKKDGGATKFNSVAVTGPDPEVRSMFNFRSGATNELVVATRDNRLLVVGTGGITKTLYTAAGVSWYHSPLVEGFDGTSKALYHFGGWAGYPQVYTGGASARMQLGSAVGTVTADSATDTFTRTSHGLSNGTRVFFSNSGGALPTNIFEDSIPYYVINTAANTFQVSTTLSGSAHNFTTNGTGTHTVHRSTMPLDWTQGTTSVRWGFMHRGRMYVGGGDALPYTVYVSVLDNHNDYLNSGTLLFQIYPGEGDLCVGGISWRNKAYIFKFPYGVYVLDDSSTDTSQWGWKRISKYVGAISQASIVEADDEVYFVSPDGYIHALSAVQESGDVRSSAVKGIEIGPYLRENTDFSRVPTATWSGFRAYPVPQGIYSPVKRRLYFSFTKPGTASSQGYPINKTVIGLDLHRSDPSTGIRDAQVFSITRDECESFCIYRDPTTGEPALLAGDSNGFIYKLEQESNQKDSAGYTASFETKTFYPYGNTRRANMRELQVVFAPGSSNNSVRINVYQDGVLAAQDDLSDTNPRMRLYGDCKRFHIVGENSTGTETFSITRIDVRYLPGNEE